VKLWNPFISLFENNDTKSSRSLAFVVPSFSLTCYWKSNNVFVFIKVLVHSSTAILNQLWAKTQEQPVLVDEEVRSGSGSRLCDVGYLKLIIFLFAGSPLCNYDYVALYDGQTDSSRRIGMFCGSVIPPTLHSSSNFMLVKFHSDIRRTHNGFSVKWNSTDVRVRVTPRTPSKVTMAPQDWTFQVLTADFTANALISFAPLWLWEN